MTDFNHLPEQWAKEEATSEADAFENALRASTIKQKLYEPDDEVEQAYRQGWHDGFKCCNDKMASKFLNENAELRDTIKIQAEQIQRLRECINRNHEDFYD